jgi:uncharacterized membrane protein
MSEKASSTAPRWFLIVGIVALVWNLLGVMAYIMQVTMSPEDLAALPEAQRTLYETTPAWATGAFALAVNGGALGCLFLVLRKNLALPFLVLSLAAVLVQFFHAFFMSHSYEVFGPQGMIMPVMVFVIAVYLVFLARSARARGWLG